MGTDIHLGVERLHNGSWEPLDVLPSHEELIEAYTNIRSEDPALGEPAAKLLGAWPMHRDYDLFAMLADVRNGVGFGGMKRAEPVTPLFAGRGRPEDTSFPLHDGDHWLGGYHSFTWCTYAEAMKAPWTRGVSTYGVVEFSEWVRWKTSEDLTPKMWSASIGGGGTKIVGEETALHLQESGEDTDGLVYVTSQWEWKPLADSPFRRWLLTPEFQAAAEKYGPENIRICMSFDS